jgi:hypothetical protein
MMMKLATVSLLASIHRADCDQLADGEHAALVFVFCWVNTEVQFGYQTRVQFHGFSSFRRDNTWFILPLARQRCRFKKGIWKSLATLDASLSSKSDRYTCLIAPLDPRNQGRMCMWSDLFWRESLISTLCFGCYLWQSS